MKHFATLLALLAAALCASAQAQVRRHGQTDTEEGIYSRTVIHPDETRTVSKQDINNKIREKRTLDKNGILLMKSIFGLNAQGQAINGIVYDGRNRVLYRSEFKYDNSGSLEEERVYDARGTLVRRLFYKKDRLGRPKPVSQTVFANGVGQTTSSSDSLENYSTNSNHAYRGGSGVGNTLSAYTRPSSNNARSSSSSSSNNDSRKRSEKRDRRFGIFKKRSK